MPIYLAFKEVWRNKGRFALIASVVMLITVLVLFVAALAEGLGGGNREYISKLNGDLIVYQQKSDYSISASRVSRTTLNNVSRVEGVAAAAPIGISNTAIILPNDPQPLKVGLIGVEPERPGAVPVVEGVPLTRSLGREVVLDRNTANRGKLKVGDTLTIKSTQGNEDELYELNVVGISDGRQYGLQPTMFVSLNTWDRIRTKGVVDANAEIPINVVVVKLADPNQTKEVTERLLSEVEKIEVADLKKAYESLPGYSAQQSTLNTQQFFTLFIGVLVIGGFFQIQMLQKVAQIGMLKAIGASNRTIAIAALMQIVGVAVFGVLVGAVATYLFSLTFPPTLPIVFRGDAVALAVTLLLLIGPVGGFLSVRYALQIEPLKALGLAS